MGIAFVLQLLWYVVTFFFAFMVLLSLMLGSFVEGMWSGTGIMGIVWAGLTALWLMAVKAA